MNHDDVELMPRAIAARAAKKSKSLRPGPALMDACVAGNVEAMAIRDAWRFRFPVTILKAEAYERQMERGSVVFHG